MFLSFFKWVISDNKYSVKPNYLQIIKHLLFYIPYEIWKHNLYIDFIASVYELFDNPSYIQWIIYSQMETTVHSQVIIRAKIYKILSEQYWYKDE